MAEKKETKKEFVITREFDAPMDLIWEVHTDPKHLEKWWGPVGLKVVKTTVDLRPEGLFHYGMEAPDGKLMWGKFVYKEIVPKTKLVFVVSFSDEKGGYSRHPMAPDWPLEMLNTMTLSEKNGKTTLTLTGRPINATPAEEAVYYGAFEGMNQGFGGTYNQLENYLKTQQFLIKQNKTTNKARVSSYLNFPGNTEEAFNFYKKIFKTEFSGKGIQRFSDFPPPEGAPPMSEENKNLIIHIELPTLGGHVLMATDAPESMGFKLITGNNMNIHLEPDSKEETIRLFNELSEGGTITMELQDMFFGAYFGMFTDKYGINWMLNYAAK